MSTLLFTTLGVSVVLALLSVLLSSDDDGGLFST